MSTALRGKQIEKIGKGSEIPRGTKVGLRLDIPAYTYNGVWVPTIHKATGAPIAHEPVARITNASFTENFDRLQQKSLKVAQGASKSPFAVITGDWQPTSTAEAKKLADQALKNPQEWTQVGFDPTRHGYFYSRENHRMVVESADEVIQVGPLVLAKNAKLKYFEDADVTFMPADQKSLPASPAISNPKGIEPRMPSSNPYLQRKPVPLPTVPAAKLGDQEERLNSYLELLKN